MAKQISLKTIFAFLTITCIFLILCSDTFSPKSTLQKPQSSSFLVVPIPAGRIDMDHRRGDTACTWTFYAQASVNCNCNRYFDDSFQT